MTTKTRLTVTAAALTLAAVALSGCAGAGKTTKAAVPAAAQTLSGKVVETMDAGGYTYVSLEKDGKKTWVAVPAMKVTVGQDLAFQPGGEIPNFSSKSLNRTFEKIIFSAGLAEGVAAAPPTTVVDPKESLEPVLSGKIVETMDAANYTYVLLEKDGKRGWAAVPTANVKVGDEIELQPGTVMGKFTSKRLNRTFNAIYFAGGVKSAKGTAVAAAAPAAAGAAAAADALPAGHPKVDMTAQGAAPAPEPPVATPITGKVVETTDAGGYTYICLEKDAVKTWVAVPPTKVEVGQEMAVYPGVAMNNFVSKSLNRTFEKIIFSQGIAK